MSMQKFERLRDDRPVDRFCRLNIANGMAILAFYLIHSAQISLEDTPITPSHAAERILKFDNSTLLVAAEETFNALHAGAFRDITAHKPNHDVNYEVYIAAATLSPVIADEYKSSVLRKHLSSYLENTNLANATPAGEPEYRAARSGDRPRQGRSVRGRLLH